MDAKDLRVQGCPKKGINPIVILWGWDWDHQSYSIGRGLDAYLVFVQGFSVGNDEF